MEEVISIAGSLTLLVVVGCLIGAADRKNFSFNWLLVASGLVLLNDVLLTSAYGLVPSLIPETRWNWQGKLLALTGALAVASLPAFGWKRSGLVLSHAKGSLAACSPLALAYFLFFFRHRAGFTK